MHLLIPPATILNIPDILVNVSCLDDPVIHMAGIFTIIRLSREDVLHNNYGRKKVLILINNVYLHNREYGPFSLQWQQVIEPSVEH